MKEDTPSFWTVRYEIAKIESSKFASPAVKVDVPGLFESAKKSDLELGQIGPLVESSRQGIFSFFRKNNDYVSEIMTIVDPDFNTIMLELVDVVKQSQGVASDILIYGDKYKDKNLDLILLKYKLIYMDKISVAFDRFSRSVELTKQRGRDFIKEL